MKRFWLVLLSLGLVMAFSASVFAADVKFTGSFYAAGMYQDNTFTDEDVTTNASTAFYYQRLRVQMEFIATPYLKLVTRFDAMERIWGGVRSATGIAQDIDGSMGSRNENENIAFDYAYLWYASKIGIWSVGYQSDGAWGTVFANNDEPEAKLAWMFVKMPFIAGLQVVKFAENDTTMVNGKVSTVDRDYDKYQGYVIYNFKGDKVAGQAGVLGVFLHGQEGYSALGDFATQLFILQPYAKVKIGPVAIEAEVDYAWGKYANWADGIATNDVKVSNLQAYINALADFGMFYVGGTLAFMDGDKQSTASKIEGGILNGGRDWNPCLIMFNWDRYYWAGSIPGTPGPFGSLDDMAAPMNNAYFAQIMGGVRPIADLDIMASVSWAKAVRTPTLNNIFTGAGAVDLGKNEEYGYEVDVTATYKITNNLSYMLGAGYWFVGDYYKALSTTADTDDNFLVINKLTLTF